MSSGETCFLLYRMIVSLQINPRSSVVACLSIPACQTWEEPSFGGSSSTTHASCSFCVRHPSDNRATVNVKTEKIEGSQGSSVIRTWVKISSGSNMDVGNSCLYLVSLPVLTRTSLHPSHPDCSVPPLEAGPGSLLLERCFLNSQALSCPWLLNSGQIDLQAYWKNEDRIPGVSLSGRGTLCSFMHCCYTAFLAASSVTLSSTDNGERFPIVCHCKEIVMKAFLASVFWLAWVVFAFSLIVHTLPLSPFDTHMVSGDKFVINVLKTVEGDRTGIILECGRCLLLQRHLCQSRSSSTDQLHPLDNPHFYLHQHSWLPLQVSAPALPMHVLASLLLL